MRNKMLKRMIRRQQRRELKGIDAIIPQAVAYAQCCGRSWRENAQEYYLAIDIMTSRRWH